MIEVSGVDALVYIVLMIFTITLIEDTIPVSSQDDTKQVWSLWQRILHRYLTSGGDESESHAQLFT